MKSKSFYRAMLPLICFLVYGLSSAQSQNKQTENTQNKDPNTKISYKVTFGPVYPIEGESYQVVGEAALDDSTGQLKSLSFDVPLISFVGQHADYLAWVGNSWENPDLRFGSSAIEWQDDSHLSVRGNLDFRMRSSSVDIKFTKEDKGNEVVLKGSFIMNTSDFFTFPPSQRLVPSQIPFELTFVFDKPSQDMGRAVSLH